MYIEVCEQILRRTVLSFYERNQLSKIKEDLGGENESLRTVLHKKGFKYSKVDGQK